MEATRFKLLLEKAKVTLSHVGKITIILIAMVFGYATNEIYRRVVSNERSQLDLKSVHHLSETSVAINERSEFLIINSKNGTYEVYDD